MYRFTRFNRLLPAMLLWPALLPAQTIRVNEDENFRAEPAGQIVARVLEGTILAMVGRQGDWIQATLEGWIWAPSVRPDARPGFDLAVAVAAGENLRSEPNGTRIARLHSGMLLNELGRQDNWVRVRRTAWIWARSTTTVPGPAAAAPGDPATATAGTWARAGEAGSVLLGTPGSDTIGQLDALVPIEIISRDGNWARIRLEAWTWAPALAAVDSGPLLRGIDPAAFAENPDAFRGRLIECEIQFIALDKAERIRTDFYEGEPFILARPVNGGGGFVYVAVPPDRLAQVRTLSPLQRISIMGRIRSGWSVLLAAPVLDLLEIR